MILVVLMERRGHLYRLSDVVFVAYQALLASCFLSLRHRPVWKPGGVRDHLKPRDSQLVSIFWTQHIDVTHDQY